MKKIFTTKHVLLLLFFCIILFVFMKPIFMWPGFYKNNSNLSREENKQIKSLLLYAMKDQHLKIFSVDTEKLYTDEYLQEHMQYGESHRVNGIFVNVNINFMDSVEKTDDNEYKAVVQLLWPDDWRYYFTIKVVENRYVISDLGIDP